MKKGLVNLGLVFLCSSASAMMREWRDARGNLVEAEYVRMETSDVIVRDSSGRSHLIPLAILTDQDKEYLRTVFVPDTTISVSINRRKPWRPEYAWAEDRIEMVKAEVKIRSKSEVPINTLRTEALLIGAEVATPDFRIMSRTMKMLEFSEENNFTAEYEVEEMKSRQYVEYNFQKRGTLYAGYLVLVLNQKNEVVNYETNISWLTEEKVSLLRQFRVDAFFNDACKKRPVPRPEYVEEREGFVNF